MRRPIWVLTVHGTVVLLTRLFDTACLGFAFPPKCCPHSLPVPKFYYKKSPTQSVIRNTGYTTAIGIKFGPCREYGQHWEVGTHQLNSQSEPVTYTWYRSCTLSVNSTPIRCGLITLAQFSMLPKFATWSLNNELSEKSTYFA